MGSQKSNTPKKIKNLVWTFHFVFFNYCFLNFPSDKNNYISLLNDFD
jgi:hypothetical protein